MADYKVTDTELTSVANAIRAKTGKSAQIEFPTEFVSEIGSISGGGSNIDIPNDNILANWNFTDPSNSRGLTHWDSLNDNIAWTVDGWGIWHGSVDVVSGGIKVAKNPSYNLIKG
jgi:hypothetical protein